MVNANPGPPSAQRSSGSLAAASPPAVGLAGTAGWSSAHFRRPLRVASRPAPRVSARGLGIDLPCSLQLGRAGTIRRLTNSSLPSRIAGPECRWRDPGRVHVQRRQSINAPRGVSAWRRTHESLPYPSARRRFSIAPVRRSRYARGRHRHHRRALRLPLRHGGLDLASSSAPAAVCAQSVR